MTINSLFILGTSDLKVFMEKHWCSAIKRSVLDDFLEQVTIQIVILYKT